MIDKSHLRTTMLALTEAELAQAHKTYERFLAAARLDRFKPVENDEQAQAETAADLAGEPAEFGKNRTLRFSGKS